MNFIGQIFENILICTCISYITCLEKFQTIGRFEFLMCNQSCAYWCEYCTSANPSITLLSNLIKKLFSFFTVSK